MSTWSYSTRTSGSFPRDIRLGRLFSELEHSFFTKDGGLPPRHRQRYIQALFYLGDFLDAHGAPDPIVRELMELCAALGDLDRGVVRPFLEADRLDKGRRPHASDVWLVKAQVAIAVSLMIKGRMSEVGALAAVEAEIGFLLPLLAGPTAKSLSTAAKDWRRILQDGDCQDARAQRYYNLHPDASDEECLATAQALLVDIVREALALDPSRLTDKQMANIRRRALRVKGAY